VAAPRVFSDELLYFDAAGSLSEGDGLSVQGEPYRYSPLYPTLLAPILLASPDREVAYELVKALNALLFALVAVPVFLLARRILAPWPSVAVSALAVAIPSSVYVSVVTSEALAYLTATWAVYAIVCALERPTPLRQGLVLTGILVACAVRLQFLILYPAYVIGLVTVMALSIRVRRRWRRELWPTAVSVAVSLALVVVGSFRPALLGSYESLWESYDLAGVARWFGYHLANLALYLAVVPLAVLPIVLSLLLRRARSTSPPHAAFLVTFVLVNLGVLFVAAAFDSGEHGLGRLHDRYVFYVAPLWLVALFYWFQEGAPRPRVASVIGAVLALVFVGLFPLSALHERNWMFDGVGTTLWAAADEAVSSSDVSLRLAMTFFTSALVALMLFLPRRLLWLVPISVFSTFALSSALVWNVGLDAARGKQNDVFPAQSDERRWVDERVPKGGSVTTLLVPCATIDLSSRSLSQTEFFNSAVKRAVHVRRGSASAVSSGSVEIGADGALAYPSGEAVVADHIVSQRGVNVVGRRLGEGTRARLVLWAVHGSVRLRGARSPEHVAHAACRMTKRS